MKKGIVVFSLFLLTVLLVVCGVTLYSAHLRKAPEGAGGSMASSVDVAPESTDAVSKDAWEELERVPVFPKLSGLAVIGINVDAGQNVREGQVLAELDEVRLIADLRRLQEALRRVEKNYRDAVRSGDQEEERLKAELDETRGELANVQTKMGYRYVIAPTSGILVECNVNLGDSSRVDTAMFTIGRPMQLRSGDVAPVSGD